MEEHRNFRNKLEDEEEKKLMEERDAFERNLEGKEKQIVELATAKISLTTTEFRLTTRSCNNVSTETHQHL